MNLNLNEFQEVGNVRVFFKVVNKEGKQYIDTLIVFPDNHDFLMNPSRVYSPRSLALFKHCAKSVL